MSSVTAPPTLSTSSPDPRKPARAALQRSSQRVCRIADMSSSVRHQSHLRNQRRLSAAATPRRRRSPPPGQLLLFDPFATHNDRDGSLRLAPVPRHSTPEYWARPGQSGPLTAGAARRTPSRTRPPRSSPQPLPIRLASPRHPRSSSPQTEACSTRRLPPTASWRRSFHPSSRSRASDSQTSQALRTTSARRLTSSSDRWLASRPTLRRSSSSRHWRPRAGPATPDERAVLARFSGFGDSTFEPAFRLSAHRPEDQRLGRARTPPSLPGG